MEDSRVSSSNSSSSFQNCSKDQWSGEVNYETCLADLGGKPNQPTSFNFLKWCIGIKSATYRSFQPAWFNQWPWISYDQQHDRTFCFCCVQAVTQEKLEPGCLLTSKTSDAFLTQGLLIGRTPLEQNMEVFHCTNIDRHSYCCKINSNYTDDFVLI